MSAATLNVLLTHLPPARVDGDVCWWREKMPGRDLLVAYGGDGEAFGALGFDDKVFVEGRGHRVADLQRDRQSYSGVVKAVSNWLAERPYAFVNLFEYDVLPLSADWIDECESVCRTEGAALLGHQLQQVDQTFNANYLSHAYDPEFAQLWERVSVRDRSDTVLSIIGCHTFWRRDLFDDVAARPEPMPMYLELYLPTMAHHLGYRVRPFGDTSGFIRPSPEFGKREIRSARESGALAVHPVKEGWR